ncbi:hypothetical protein ACTHQF_00260 [Pedobacter sp. SAFR-022]|uniref:hypothetical protein n=1 Tax=Pedobacter sp. SAFR-022 TaxID=3436861 RepID=UPI003F7EFDBB
MEVYLINACGNIILMLYSSNLGKSFDSYQSTTFKLAEQYQLTFDLMCMVDKEELVARFWNRDKTEEEVCFNAIRSIALLLQTESKKNVLRQITTKKGPFIIRSNKLSNELHIPYKYISYYSEGLFGLVVDVGTLHLTIEEVNLEKINYEDISGLIKLYFISYSYYHHHNGLLYGRTFERGVGETNSCGSGAVSMAVAYWIKVHGTFMSDFKTNVIFNSGEILEVESHSDRKIVILRGKSKLIKMLNLDV